MRPTLPNESQTSTAPSFARNSMVNALAGVFITLGGFVSTIVVARLLGVQGTGAVAFATWAVTCSIIIADFGITGSLTRFLPELIARQEFDEATRLTRLLLKVFLAGTLVVAALFWLYAAWLLWRQPLGAPLAVTGESYATSPLFWTLIGLASLTQSLASFVNAWLKGCQDFPTLARTAAVTCLVQIVATVLGSRLFGVGGALAAMALSALVPVVVLTRVSHSAGSVADALRRRVARFSLESWGGYLLTAFFASRMEIFFLERSWGSHAVGLFTVSLTLSNLATQGPLLLTGAVLPRLSQHLGRDEQVEARAVYSASVRLMALMVLPACLGTAAIAPVLLPVMYGQPFAAATLTSTILLAAAALVASTSVAGVFLIATEQTRFLLGVSVGGAALSILAGMTIVPAFGPLAAALGRGVIQVIFAACMLWYLNSRLRCPTPFGVLGRLLAAAIACAVVARLVVVELPNVTGLLLAIPAGALTYAVAIRLLHPLPDEDLEKVRTAILALPRMLRPAARAGMHLILS